MNVASRFASAALFALATSAPIAAFADLPSAPPAVPSARAPRLHAEPAKVVTGALKLIVTAPGTTPTLGASPAPASAPSGAMLAPIYNLVVEPLTVHVPPAFLRKLGNPLGVSCSVQHGGQLVGHGDLAITVPASGNLDANFNQLVGRSSATAAIPVDHANCHLAVHVGGAWTLLSSYVKSAAGVAALSGFALSPESILDNVVEVK